MPSPTAALAVLLALAALAPQTAGDLIEDVRARLDAERRELLTTLRDAAAMRDTTRATLARLAVVRNWTACAENEALAQAHGSERPARLLAEAALAACRPWGDALELALANGAYPYLEGPGVRPDVSREDMVAAAELDARDAALARIMMWRAGGPRIDAPAPATAPPAPRAEQRAAPPEPDSAEAMEIVVVARGPGACRVRLADRNLSERELAARAREWAKNGTPLRVVRPRGADYGCMAQIAWQLGKQGVRLFEFVEASAAAAPNRR